MAGTHDVAKYAGVSPSTMSRTLSDVAFVESETKEKALKAVSDLNYKPDLATRSLERGGSWLIGLTIPNITNPYFPEAVEYMELRAAEAGYSLVLYGSLGDVERGKDYFERLKCLSVDEILYISATDFVEHVKSYIGEIPMVIVNRTFGVGTPCFNIGNGETVGQAMKYLIQSGHEKIVLYSSDKNRQYNQGRLEGCMEVWSQYHQGHSLMVIRDVTSERDACQKTMELVRSPNRPTAVFPFSDSMADGMHSGIRKSGLTIPSGISVVGFDDVPHVKYSNPPLTTVRYSLPGVSETIFDCLSSQVTTQTCAPHSSVYLKGQLIERGSVRKLI